MSQPASVQPKLTPLHGKHLALGARLVPFAGWSMPVEYSGRAEEHLAVRTRAGLFDLTPMGQIEVAGARALDAIQWVGSNDASLLELGQTQHSALTTPEGTVVDDMLTYRFGDQHFLLVVNASNVGRDFAWISEHTRRFDVAAVNTSARYALLALQGPAAPAVMQRLVNFDLATLKHAWFQHGEVASVRGTVSRTGYTGEDGFEVFVPPRQAAQVWDAILDAGVDEGVCPAGLGARDSLRVEAAMRLAGQDIDEGTTLLEAGLESIVGWDKGDFLGRAALEHQKARGIGRRLVGFEMAEPAIASHGDRAFIGGEHVGHVTSGTQAPFLEKAIGLAYLPVEQAVPGSEFDVDVTGRMVRARVVTLPFYKRPRG